jgi:hypothetical protein
MSRRSRHGKSTGQAPWLGRLGIGVAVISLLSIAVGYAGLRRYLHSDAFRQFLSAEASRAAGVKGEFAHFRWDGLAVNTESFQGSGAGSLTGVQAAGLHTEVGLGAVRRGIWEIRSSSVRRLDLSVDARAPLAPPTSPSTTKELMATSHPPAWMPSKVEVQGLDIRELNLKALFNQGLVTMTGLQVHAEMAGAKDSYRAELEGGSIRSPFPLVPELRLDGAHLRYQDHHAFLTKATVNAWENGLIHATGEWDMKSQQFSLAGDASGITCQEVLDPSWAKRLTGSVSSSFSLHNRTGSPEASGTLKLENGVLTALPILDALAAYADTRRFRILTLNESRTDWHWKKGEIALSRLVFFAEGLVRVEGGLVIREQEIDGVFRLGLAPGTLANIPGAETDVFLAGERGLLWTTVRITGTLDAPKEDLTDRLMTAAGLRMFDHIPETGEKVIKFTQSILGDTSNKTLEKGTQILEQGGKTLRDVSGILESILGSGARKIPKADDAAQ